MQPGLLDLLKKFNSIKTVNIPSAKEYFCLKCQSFQKVFFKIEGGIPKMIEHEGKPHIALALSKYCQACKGSKLGDEKNFCGAV